MARLTDSRGSWFPDNVKWAIATGKIPGWRAFRQFGMNEDVDNGSEDVWAYGGVYAFPTAAAQVSVVSSSAADNPAGTGVGSLLVEGVDASGFALSEVVSLNGLTPVLTVGSYYRVNRITAVAPGSASTTNYNAGAITATISGGVVGYIEVREGTSHQMIYTVPADYYAMIIDTLWGIGVDTAGTKTLKHCLEVKPHGGAWTSQTDQYIATGSIMGISPGFILPPRCDARAHVTSEANNVPVWSSASGFLIETAIFDAL